MRRKDARANDVMKRDWCADLEQLWPIAPARVSEGDRVAPRRLVLAPVEQVLRCRGGAFQGGAAVPEPGPRRVGSEAGIERGQGRAGEKQGLGLGMVAKRPAQARPTGRGVVPRGRALRESSQQWYATAALMAII
jgi:hypothetical protein